MKRISLGPRTSLNIGKRSTSVSTKLGKGMTLTSGARGTTLTRTTKLSGGFSFTTKTRNGKTSTKLNRPKKWW